MRKKREKFRSRVRQFMAFLTEMNCKNVAVFSPAGWLREAVDEVLGVRLPQDGNLCNIAPWPCRKIAAAGDFTAGST